MLRLLLLLVLRAQGRLLQEGSWGRVSARPRQSPQAQSEGLDMARGNAKSLPEAADAPGTF